MSKTAHNPERAAFEILVSRYRTNPEVFEQHLPDVSQILRQVVEPSRGSMPDFSLTEREKAHHVEALSSVLDKSQPSSRDVVKALECCAILVQDDFMTPHVHRELVVSLFKTAFGKSPGAIRKNMSIPIEGHGTGEPI